MRFTLRSRLPVALCVLLLALLPILASGPADAATLRTWNRLAQCESGGRWHINTGNGYYGGLQFSHATWIGFGGGRYARNAHRATKYQQIRIAERVKRVQGWRAWPVCSRRIGLR
ncbi:MAG: transglycosylase family protein [Nocardioidaceae bacterium]|nr:transglycosylase family protein [Nocardioidaceae bacterium]NUS50660.1 transglycosylase family protein [Nocardioidaceae bacterium]